MLQVVYLPGQNIEIEKFITISSMDELLDFIKFNKIKLLSIPATDDALDVLDCIIENELKIETIHLQQSNDLLSRLKILERCNLEANFLISILIKMGIHLQQFN